MGNSNIFAKAASIDPIAQALHLPGATKYAQQEAQNANSTGAVGPYAGVTPTLAGANAGYAPGGPGSNPGYVPFKAQAPGGAFGFLQRAATAAGSTTPNPAGGVMTPSNPGQIQNQFATGSPTGMSSPYGSYTGNPYAQAASQAAMNPQVSSTGLFRQQQGVTRGF